MAIGSRALTASAAKYGRGVQYRRLDPVLMERACRDLARALRHEAANGWPELQLTHSGGFGGGTISRKAAAELMEAQAERWAAEVRTGKPNVVDREKIGFPS